MSLNSSALSSGPRPTTLGLVAVLLAAELLVISLAYQHSFDYTCRDTAPVWFCAFASRIVPRTLAVIAGLTLFALARRRDVAALLSAPGPRLSGLFMNLAGFALAMLPWFSLSDASPVQVVILSGIAWLGGAALAGAGLALLLASGSAWAQFLRQHGLVLAGILAAGLAMPELADLLFPIWRTDTVTEITFAAVYSALSSFGYDVFSDPATKGIGTTSFYVLVGPQCSGVEGFMLVTAFLTLYLLLFRRELRFPHVLILYPIGLCVSWCFNVLRIVLLLVIGIEGQPELAVGAFHSHAGWLSFTILSILLILASRLVPWFRVIAKQAPSRSLPPFFEDPAVVAILPFLVFMASALLSSTFSESPALLYPWRVLAMGVVLALVWQGLRALPWRVDGLAVGIGAFIAAFWIMIPVEGGDASAPYGSLTGALLVLWFIARGFGTIVLVPVIEEMFFRNYLERLLRPGPGLIWAVGAAVVTAVIFAALHGRWAEAFVAGLLFSWLAARRGNITDAIIAHGVANALIFGAAVLQNDLSMI